MGNTINTTKSLPSSYKPERFYWEIIISTRKVAVVALSIFGSKLGAERQCQIALLLLLGCLVLEIAGDPYRRVTPAHSVLSRLEVSSLLLEWITLWCGLVIYKSESGSEHLEIFISMFVVICNVLLVLWFLFVLVGAYVKLRCFGSKSFMAKLKKCLHVRKDENSIMVANPLAREPKSKELELVGSSVGIKKKMYRL